MLFFFQSLVVHNVVRRCQQDKMNLWISFLSLSLSLSLERMFSFDELDSEESIEGIKAKGSFSGIKTLSSSSCGSFNFGMD